MDIVFGSKISILLICVFKVVQNLQFCVFYCNLIMVANNMWSLGPFVLSARVCNYVIFYKAHRVEFLLFASVCFFTLLDTLKTEEGHLIQLAFDQLYTHD